MNKITILSTVLSLLFTFSSSVNYANAGLFDWINQKTDTEKAVVIDSDNWNFDKTFQEFQNMFYGKNIAVTTEESDSKIESSPLTAPKAEFKSIKTHMVTATGYSSTPDQTDDTPFTTASGTTVRDGIVATNFLPFGTLIKIPKLFGDKIFTVEDRMNRRYKTRVDIWFPERELAKIFGIKEITIEVVALAPQK